MSQDDTQAYDVWLTPTDGPDDRRRGGTLTLGPAGGDLVIETATGTRRYRLLMSAELPVPPSLRDPLAAAAADTAPGGSGQTPRPRVVPPPAADA